LYYKIIKNTIDIIIANEFNEIKEYKLCCLEKMYDVLSKYFNMVLKKKHLGLIK
jgi:hypothetical protein